MMNVDTSSYNWPGVLEFLYAEYQKVSLKQNMWFLQKKELTDQIKQLEGKLAAAEGVNSDLKHKNNMLEHCLRQIKLKNKVEQEPSQEPEIPIPQRRPKSNKAQISKILCSLGVTNLLQNINKDIKSKVPNNTLKIDIPQAIIQSRKTEIPVQKGPNNYKEIAHLQEHQDGVRDLCFLNDKQYLVSVSEDSTMKVWNIEKAREKIDCITTIREHSGPIFTAVEGQGYLFTGGMQGIIRCWNFPRKMNGNQNQKKYLCGSWTNNQEQKLQPIWQLLYYPQRKLIFSTSSEVAVRAFQLEYEQNSVASKYKSSYIYQSKNTEEQDIPTAICIHQNSLFTGYVNNNFLVQFNLQTQKAVNNIQFQADGQISTNRIASNGHILVGAFEDAMIRVFDKSKVVHSFQAHQESVMSVCFTSNPHQLFSCGQDGAVKLWDMRKHSQVLSFKAHKSKYDEAGHCISYGKGGYVASGGADGVIKVFGIQN